MATRTESSVKNLIYAISGQTIGVVISFLARVVFLKILSTEYLGLNNLFYNILTVLSFAELGFGNAITFSLYKPLEEKNTEKLKTLMKLFKTIYTIVGIVIFIFGIMITPFLSFFIKDMPENISNINLIYILFVINTSISYFYSYKKTLIIADQKSYVTTFYKYVCYALLNIAQIIALFITKQYMLYLVLQVFFTFIENILISRKADKIYPFLKEKEVKKLDVKTRKNIFSNTKAMMMHKVGDIIVNSTDTIIISKFVSLEMSGLYSNYLSITTALNTVVSQIYSSVSASVGNLCASETKNKQYEIFKKMNFLGFWIGSFASICLAVLLTPFIKLWIGEEYLLSIFTSLLIVIIFFISCMRNSVLTFREALGLFYKDRYKPIIEAIVNLITSVILAKKFGIAGIFMGTIISYVTVCIWVESYILFKYGFGMKVSKYFKKYFIYWIFTLAVGAITYYLCNRINVQYLLLELILKAIICIIIPNSMIFIIFGRTEEFKYFKDMIYMFLKNRREWK